MTRRGARITTLLSLAGILAVAAWVRLAIYPHVLARGEILPQVDGDAFFHLKRILETVREFPRVPHFDPMMNWPAGAFVPWADGFDLGGAAWVLALGGGGDPGRARIAAALWPWLLGVLAVAATYGMVRTCLPGRAWAGAALAAAAGAALVPGSIFVGLLGRIDHHGAEALFLVLLFTWAMRAFPPVPAAGPPRPGAFEGEGALLTGLALFVYTGSPLFAALVSVPLLVAALRRGRVLGSGGPGLVAGAGVAALLSVPFVRDTGSAWTFKNPSLIQPLFVAGCGLAVAAVAWIAGASGRGRVRRAAIAGSALVATALGLAIATPVPAQVAEAVSGWLLHRDPWIAGIQEFAPMYRTSPSGVPPWSGWHMEFGWAGFFLPVALVVVAARAGARSRARVLLFATVTTVLLAVMSNRYSRVAIPFLAATNGIAVAAVLGRVLPAGPAGRLPAWAPLTVLLATAADLPTLGLLLPPRPRVQPIVDVALHLRDFPPPRSDAPGVLSNWSYGHQIEVVAGLPVVVNGFGSYLDAPRFWEALEIFKDSPDALDRYMLRNRLGLVVAGTATIGSELTGADESPSFARGGLNQTYMRSLPLSPLLIAGSAIPGWDVPHLPTLMPRYASSAVVAGIGFKLPFLWVYERVAGARLRGSAAPGTRVLAELGFSEHRRPHVYKAYAEAAADGTWEIVVPLPSGARWPAFRTDPAWSVSAAGGPAVLVPVPEDAVRGGRIVQAGALPPPPPGG